MLKKLTTIHPIHFHGGKKIPWQVNFYLKKYWLFARVVLHEFVPLARKQAGRFDKRNSHNADLMEETNDRRVTDQSNRNEQMTTGSN